MVGRCLPRTLPHVLFLSLFLWPCRCGGPPPLRTTLPTHTQVDRPGCIAGVTQLSTSGLGRVEGPRRPWGSLGGLPGPASSPLLRPRLLGRVPHPPPGTGRGAYCAQEHRIT